MSSYQHQCMLGNVMRDSHPDYLTCGYCAREFLLDNITLFIAHKTGGCDQSSYLRSATFHDAEDTSAPLTCSTCSRVFMTARGLLHHVQEDHQMLLCLQKGPLLLPHKEIRPPPAHSSCNGVEFSRTPAEQPSCCFASSPSSCGPNDQPTDLSMTCSNSLGKARITCSEDKCQITLQPTCNVTSTRMATALPKKRKVLFQQNPSFDGEEFDHPAAGNNRNRSSNSHEDVSSTDSYENNSGPTAGKAVEDNEVSICVTAEYQQDTLCCVSLSTEKKEHDKHAKLKRLLEGTTPTAESQEFQEQEGGAKTTKVVYEVPFLSPPNLESAVLRATANETSGKDDNHQGVSNTASATDPQDTSSKLYKSNNDSRLTMEANGDRLFQSSISSESFSEEIDIFSLQHESSHSSSRQRKQHRLDGSGTPMQSSPRLLMPEANNTFPSQISLSCPSLDASGQGSINSNSEHWNNMFLGDDHHRQSTSGITTAMPSALLGINSLRTGPAQNETVKLQSSLSFPGLSTPVSNQTTLDVYNDLSLLRHHHGDHSSKQPSDNTARFGEGLLKLLEQNTPCHTSKVQSKLPEPSVSFIGDLTGGNPSIQQWLNIHSQDYANLTGTGSTNRPASEHLDPASYEHVEPPSVDIHDDAGADSKAIKRRRYPTSRPFKCPGCDQAFNQRIHLKKHMSKHTGVKPFKCQQCDYSTVERSHLKVHYRIHTGEKPYRCMFCDYATAQNSTLKIHMKRHHETQTDADCSNLRDNSYQPTGPLDDESWSLQDTFFLHRPMKTPGFDDELNQPSFIPGGKAAHALSIENSFLAGGHGDGDTRGGSSSPSTSTDHGHKLYVTAVQKVQTAESVTDHMSFRDAKRNIHRKSAVTNRDQYDNSGGPSLRNNLVRNTHMNAGKTAAVEFKCSAGEDRGNLSCLSSEDSVLARDISETGTFEDIQPSSVQILVFPMGDKLQLTNEEFEYLNRTSQVPGKSFVKRKQTAKRGNIQIGKSVKSHRSQSTGNSDAEKDVPKEKEPICVVNSNIRVHRDNEKISSKVNTIETLASNEMMKTSTMLAPELLGVDVEDDDLACNSMDNVSVTIPTKAFVRG